MAKAIWDYIVARASVEAPGKLTFYDANDQTLYTDVALQTVGEHGWELTQVLLVEPPGLDSYYQYFFKRNRAEGYSAGLGSIKDS